MKRLKKKNIKRARGLLMIAYIAITVCVIYQLHPFVHALGKKTVRMEIGAGESQVTAQLNASGRLTLSGHGRTLDFTEDSAPFEAYADQITSVKIEEGITGIGDYLFFNCKNLKGTLELPASVIWVGDGAFSGESGDLAPQFCMVTSRYVEGKLAILTTEESTESQKQPGQPTASATPGEAEKGPGETETNRQESPDETGQQRPGESESAGPEAAESTEGSGPSGTDIPEENTASSAESSAPESTGADGSKPGSESAGADGSKPGLESAGAAGSKPGSEITGTAGSKPGLESAGSAGSKPGSESTGTAGSKPGSESTGTAGSKPGLESAGAAGSKPGSESTGTAGSKPAPESTGTAGSKFGPESTGAAGSKPGLKSAGTAESRSASGRAGTTQAESSHKSAKADQSAPAQVTGQSGTVQLMGNLVRGMQGLRIQSHPEFSEENQEEPSGESLIEPEDTKAEESSAAAKPPTQQTSASGTGSDMSGVRPDTASSSTADRTEEEDDGETEPTEEDSGDGMLSNDLYENAVAYSELSAADRQRYRIETIPFQLVGTEIFYPGRRGGYQCSDGNITFMEAAAAAGYQQADRLITADMDDGTAVVEAAVINGGFYAPDLPEEIVCTEGEDDLFTNRFSGWILASEWSELGGSAPVYETGVFIPVEDGTNTVKLYSEWEKASRIEPVAVAKSGEDGSAVYTLIDGNTGMGIPEISGYQFFYQWQRYAGESDGREEESDGAGGETEPDETLTGPGVKNDKTLPGPETETKEALIGPGPEAEIKGTRTGLEAEPEETLTSPLILSDEISDEDSSETAAGQWTDIDGADSETYTRPYHAKDAGAYFRCVLTIRKLTRTRSSEEPLTLNSEPVMAAAGLPVTVTYAPGEGAGGTGPAQETVRSGDGFNPKSCTFTRNTDDGLAFIGWQISYMDADGSLPSGTAVAEGTVLTMDGASVTLNAAEGGSVSPQVILTAQWSSATVIYVNQGSGNDGNPGTADQPVQSMAKAFSLLPGGSAETNIIEFQANYSTSDKFMENGSALKNATFRGQGKDQTQLNFSNNNLYQQGNIIMDKLSVIIADCYSCAGYSLVVNEDTVFRGKNTWSNSDCKNQGVPNGTNASSVVLRTNETFGGTFGPHGGSIDNPIIVRFLSDGITIGRLAAGGRIPKDNTAENGNYSYSHIVIEKGKYALAIAGTIGDLDEYYHTTFTVKGGDIHNIIGGQHTSYGLIASYNGNFTVNISGGHVTELYGGPLGRGLSTSCTSRSEVLLNISGGTVDTVYAGGATGKIEGNVTTNVSQNAQIGSLYGGGYGKSPYINTYFDGAAVVTGNVAVNISGGTIQNNVYAGGFGFKGGEGSAVIGGNSSLLIEGNAKIQGNVYGGGMGITADPTAAGITGNSSVVINGGEIDGSVFGGGELGRVGGTASIHINGGTITGDVYGGGNRSGTTGATEIFVNTSMGSSSIPQNIYGAGKGGGTTVSGKASVTVSGGANIYGTIYGGGDQGAVNETAVVLSDCTIQGSVFGGGNQASVTGGVTVAVNSGTVNGSIYGGSNSSGTIGGAARMNIAGKAGAVYGGGKGSGTSVMGGTTVNIETNANITGDVYGGGEEGTVSGGVHVKVGGGQANGIYGAGKKADVAGNVTVQQTGGTTASLYGGGSDAGTGSGTVEVSLTGGTAGNIYGGSNNTGTVTSPLVRISGGTVAKVFGGGYGGSTVTTAPKVLIVSGGSVTDGVFGGGNQGTVSGGTTVSQTGGDVVSIFGGGNEVGVDGTVSISQTGGTAVNIYGGSNSSGEVIGPEITVSGTAANVYGAGKGSPTKTADPVVIADSGARITNLYGGGEEGKTLNQTTITMRSGSEAQAVFGGGNAAGIDGAAGTATGVLGTAVIDLEEHSKTFKIYGGSNSSGAVGAVRMTLNGLIGDGTTPGAVYGGGLGQGTSTAAPSVTVGSTGAVNGTVFGGGADGQITGDTKVILETGGTVIGTVYAGGQGQSAEIGGSTEAEISTAVTGDVYGGGAQGPVAGGTKVVVKAGGQITGTVYAGGDEAAVGNHTVTSGGNTVLTVESGAAVTGSLYGGGKGTSASVKSSSVTVEATVTGDVYGGGAQGPVTVGTEVILKSGARIKAPSGALDGGNVYAGGDAALVGIEGNIEGGTTSLTAEEGSTVEGSIYGGGKGQSALVINDTFVTTQAGSVKNVFGGGALGAVYGSTSVNVIKGTVGDGSDGSGNVFGGSDKAKVYKNTHVRIGKTAASEAGIPSAASGANLRIRGTVFGGGNTTDNGSTFDATDPFVLGTASVEVDGTDYAGLRVEKSIFGDGNMCTVSGTRRVQIKNYTALGSQAGTSIQRTDYLTLDQSSVELSGATDSANLVPTLAYSLNRIGRMELKGGSMLKLQESVNLVKEVVSTDSAGQPVASSATTTAAAEPAVKNYIYIQQGAQMELRTTEDVTRQEYGSVSGYMLLGNFDKDGKNIENGVYLLGGYNSDDTAGGFLYADDDTAGDYVRYQKIDPTTDGSTWRNWALGKNMARDGILVMSNKPAGQKLLKVECPWPADGSIYRLVPDSVEITTSGYSGNSFVLKNPSDFKDSDPAVTTLGIQIKTGAEGWVKQVETGYVQGTSDSQGTWAFTDTSGGAAMQTINNLSIKPTIQLELSNRSGIGFSDGDGEYPLNVVFKMKSTRALSDGSEVENGYLTFRLKIRRNGSQEYEDILLTTGKEYVRADQTYTYATALGEPAATITRQSAVTLQFARRTTSESVGAQDHELSFTTNDTPGTTAVPVTLGEGVTILAVDRAGSEPDYGYYTVPPGGVSSVRLSEFIRNGTTGDRFGRSFGVNDAENFLFILDFSGAPDFSQDSLCAVFRPIYDNTAADAAVQPAKIVFNVTDSDPKTYKLDSSDKTSPDADGAVCDRDEELSFNVVAFADNIQAVDTTGTDREMGLSLRLKNRDANTYVPIPQTWILTYEGKSYLPLGNTYDIPLSSSMMGLNTSMKIAMQDSSLQSGHYQWELYLTSSSKAEYPGAQTETPVYLNFQIRDRLYSVDGTIVGSNRLYPSSASSRGTVRIDVTAKASAGSSVDNVNREISLWKKNELTGIYETVALSSVFADSSELTGPCQWSGASGEERTSAETLHAVLKPDVEVGTYRLKFELIRSGSAGGTAAADTENFLVIP